MFEFFAEGKEPLLFSQAFPATMGQAGLIFSTLPTLKPDFSIARATCGSVQAMELYAMMELAGRVSIHGRAEPINW
jgi:hypothetical protein